MKLATYRAGGAVRIGVVHAETARVFDLASAARRDGASGSEFASMLSLIDADDAGIEAAMRLLQRRASEADLWSALSDVDLLAPLPEPRQLRDAMAFPLHIRQAARGARAMKALRTGGRAAFELAIAEPLEEVPPIYREVPIHFFCNRFTVVGPGAAVNWPRYSKVIDYELELGLVTKRTAANIPVDRSKRAYIRLHDLQRLFRKGPAGDRGAGPSGPGQGQELRRLQRDRSVAGHAGRGRGPAGAQSGSSRQRRDARNRSHAGYAVFVRGNSRLHFSGRDHSRRRVLRLRLHRQLQRPGVRSFPRTWG